MSETTFQRYTCVPAYVDNNFCWRVYEPETEQYIHTTMFEKDALKRAAFYNKGGGFRGFTPSFILRGFKIK